MDDKPDPLTEPELPGQLLPPDRVFYAEGVLLDAADFNAEQCYHRGRLARVLSYLGGSGTVAGLEVSSNKKPDDEEELRVGPGLAVDRLGRLVEVPRDWCLRLGRWYLSQDPRELNDAFDASEGLVIADVFLRFVACERGRTPAFASGPFDALDAAVPSRIRDAFDIELVLRRMPNPPLPVSSPWDLSGGDPREALHTALLKAWRGGTDSLDTQGHLKADPEHVAGQDTTSIFLARVSIPATKSAGDVSPVRKLGAFAEADNHVRRFVYPTGALAAWLGILTP